ncbi:MAG: bifunctional phosphopantothenoylcysteine decarboxylase/phosphopantothenate--cysteine ligase CoaBC [Holophaga sp.]|jgi:phosphopantothenoylcysteine decarboxylase/phosphopantothenate--cysteine ligase
MKILVGITGGIAAYRAAELARILAKRGHTVRCCLTDAGSRFITPLTLASLTGQPCFGANPEYHEWRPNPIIEHVDLARWADVVVVAPATADIMGKTANGLANDLLSTVLLATTAPVLWAPAMNKAMWAHPAVQANLAKLKSFGHTVVEPAEGLLACGEEGTGRLAEVGDIADAVETLAGPPHPALAGRSVLITAGPTQEDLDPVRTLTNRSTGAMGVELARAFRNAGAKVSLVLGGDLPAPWGVATVRVRSAQQMLEACQALWPAQDGLVAAAAVADQRPQAYAKQKAKKGEGPEQLVLVRTPDVLASLSASRRAGQWLLGFAAESEAHVPNATAKLHMKHLDGILVNDVGEGQAFGHRANTLIPITADRQAEPLGPLPKDKLAQEVVRWWGDWLQAKRN